VKLDRYVLVRGDHCVGDWYKPNNVTVSTYLKLHPGQRRFAKIYWK